MENTQPTKIDTFTWDNLKADGPHTHISVMELFLQSVAQPSLEAVERKLDEIRSSVDPLAGFEMIEYEPLYSSTLQGYFLVVQSIWERQLRGYLIACALELGWVSKDILLLKKDTWERLQAQFLKLRGIALSEFESFQDLHLLHLLGNACRHGDGDSAKQIFSAYPGLWANWPPTRPEWWDGPPLKDIPTHPSFEQVTLPHALLKQMVQSVIWFWEDYDYIYTNSIKSKHHTVPRTLGKMRQNRAERVRVWSASAPLADTA
ncbi:MAG: hypothetical protein V4858_03135 [Pseudomonadota bacterium]